jgi:hypothetical protein
VGVHHRAAVAAAGRRRLRHDVQGQLAGGLQRGVDRLAGQVVQTHVVGRHQVIADAARRHGQQVAASDGHVAGGADDEAAPDQAAAHVDHGRARGRQLVLAHR